MTAAEALTAAWRAYLAAEAEAAWAKTATVIADAAEAAAWRVYVAAEQAAAPADAARVVEE